MLFPVLLGFAPLLLEPRVARVDEIVAELAQKSGQNLRVRKEIDDEAMLVSLQAHSVDELMTLLARATSPDWVRDEGRLWLERSPGLRRRQERKDATTFGTYVTRRMAPYLDATDQTVWTGSVDRATARWTIESRPEGTSTDDFRRNEAKMRALTPTGRLLSRVLRRLPPEVPIEGS